MAANNKANVSTVKGHMGGYLFSAPVGTAGAPTKTNFRPSQWLTNGEPPAGWENLGFVPEDGITESPGMESGEDVCDINGDVVDETESKASETLSVAFMENKKHALGTYYGHDNVTDENGVIEVRHNWGNAGEHYQYVFLLIMKSGRFWTKYIPDAKVSSVGEVNINRNNVVQREVTLKYLTDEDGTGCFDWMESTETPAPQLTALSGTNLTLSPSFVAGTRNYTATASAARTTITATAASGNTVSIKDGNGNTYSSGGSVPLVTGTNKITVIVTNTETGAKGIYTITVTKS